MQSTTADVQHDNILQSRLSQLRRVWTPPALKKSQNIAIGIFCDDFDVEAEEVTDSQ